MNLSVILSTIRRQGDIDLNKWENMRKNADKQSFLPDEFNELIDERFSGVDHYLEPTLESWEKQTNQDFELIIVHRWPNEVKDILPSYNLNYKLVKEKEIFWHKKEKEYSTLSNARNSGVIWSEGELLFITDDCQFFNQNLTGEILSKWNKNQELVTAKGYRRINYDPNSNVKGYIPDKQEFNFYHKENGWSCLEKFHDAEKQEYLIPIASIWGYGASVPRNHILSLNGWDECWDGASGIEDEDFGCRILALEPLYTRKTTVNPMYETDHPIPYKMINTKDNNTLMKASGRKQIQNELIESQKTSNFTKRDFVRYKKIKEELGEEMEDTLFDFLQTKYYNLEEECEKREKGELVMSNC